MFLLIDEIGSVSQVKRELNQSELDSCFRGELTVLRMKGGIFQEMNSMCQTEWTDVEGKV